VDCNEKKKQKEKKKEGGRQTELSWKRHKNLYRKGGEGGKIVGNESEG